MYKLTGVSKSFRQSGKEVHALRGVDLSVNTGEHIAVQGPTGGGKSTLLQILGALDVPTSGEVELNGNPVSKMSSSDLTKLRGSLIGFIFQNYNLIPTMTAQENVEVALAATGVNSTERRARAIETLTKVGLADRLQHLPAELSGGQQQRVAIARALVKNPAVLLADEPTGNLDEQTRDEIMDLLEAQAVENKITLIVVTHDSAVAKRAGRRLNIKDGVVREVN
ncbi:MAG: ABC transporter ATP-binding protein [Actinomycetes bacterium]|nr:ABC transporter ATP-binding protein [Actinomycetota bacterium]